MGRRIVPWTAGIGAYLAGVVRLRRAGHAWPLSRTMCWVGGLLLFAAVTGLGVARYAYVSANWSSA